jgi:CheY-like chemotaxis protein/CheY-specific phosphatase CheX
MSHPLCVLVVAKTPQNRQEIKDLLSETSPVAISFQEAETGPSAIQAYDPTRMDFAVVERFLPHMNGLDVVRILRATYGNSTPVMLVTSETSREAMEESVNDLGVNGYVLKPLTVEGIGRALAGLIAQLPQGHPQQCACGRTDCTEVVPRAAMEIVSEMCGVKASLVEGDPGLPNGDVLVGIISLFGDVKWSVKLQLPRPTAEVLVEKFAGFEVPFESPDMADAIGELTNVTVGQVKRLLVARDMDVEISLPTVFRAAQLEILLQRQTREMLSGYDTPAGRFWTTLVIGDLVPG